MSQPYPPQGPYLPPGARVHPVRPGQPRNGFAFAGFATALVGAVFALMPLIGVVAWLLSPVGLVLSVVGLTLASQRGTGRGRAIAGTVLGFVGLALCILWVAVLSAFVDGAIDG